MEEGDKLTLDQVRTIAATTELIASQTKQMNVGRAPSLLINTEASMRWRTDGNRCPAWRGRGAIPEVADTTIKAEPTEGRNATGAAERDT